jgi:hypothetical protein
LINSRVLYGILAVQSAVLCYLVLSPVQIQPTAMAQGVPDQGAQLHMLIENTAAINAKMDRIVQALEGGNLQVRIAPEKK